MNSSLRMFVNQFVCVVVASLAPVILVAFLSIPYSLGGHPGDPRDSGATAGLHMT